MKDFLKFLSLLLAVVVLIGCSGDDIAMMILKGEDLGESQKKLYADAKAQIDKSAGEILAKIAQKKIAKVSLSDNEKAIHSHNQKRLGQLVIKEAKRLRKEGKLAYRRIKGNLGIFDTSKVHKKFGFHSGDRVQTEWGQATVIGILKGDDKLWFHIDSKDGASFWSDINKKDFKLIKSAKQDEIKYGSVDKENKTSLRTLAADGTEDSNSESAEPAEKSVYLLGEVIPPIPPILNK